MIGFRGECPEMEEFPSGSRIGIPYFVKGKSVDNFALERNFRVSDLRIFMRVSILGRSCSSCGNPRDKHWTSSICMETMHVHQSKTKTSLVSKTSVRLRSQPRWILRLTTRKVWISFSFLHQQFRVIIHETSRLLFLFIFGTIFQR